MHEQHEKDEVTLRKIKLSTWKTLGKIVVKNKKPLILLVIFAVILAVIDTLIPFVNMLAIEHFVYNTEQHVFDTWFVPFIVLNGVISLSLGIVVYGFIRQGAIIEASVSYEIRKQSFATLQNLSFSFYDKTPQGQIMARMTADTGRLSRIISWGIVDLIWAFLLMLFTLILLFIYVWQLALIVSIAVPLFAIFTALIRKKVLLAHRKARHYNSQVTENYNEGFLGAKTTKSLAIENDNLLEFSFIAGKMKRASVKAAVLSSFFSNSLLVISFLVVGTTIFSGTYFYVNSNWLTIPILFLFIRSAMNFFEPIMSLTNFISELQVAQASAERIIELIETKPDIVDSEEVIEKYGTITEHKKENWEAINGEIEFKDVSFAYKEGEPILENFNLKIKSGSKVAFVGHTGSGKTTCVNLVSRFYEPQLGDILIDGTDYRQRSISWLHSQLGYVLQTPVLFSTTIMENIRYGRLTATDEEVIEAAKAIGIHDFIEKLEKGYDTNVGEGGNLLSMGQKQLISFARAIITDPKILILDEATSSIDSQAEGLIQAATNKLLADRTALMVAHRLSTIVDADMIILMDMGKIKEMGTHQELLELRGAYFDLYKSQFMLEKESEYVQSALNH